MSPLYLLLSCTAWRRWENSPSRAGMPQASALLHLRSFAGLGTTQTDKKLWRGKRKTCQAAVCYRKPWAQHHTDSASILGTLSTEMTWTYCSISRRSHKNTPRAGAPLFWRQKAGGAHPGEEKAPKELWFSSNISKNLKTNQPSNRKQPSPKAFSTLKRQFWAWGGWRWWICDSPSWFSKARTEIWAKGPHLPPFLGTRVDHLHLGLSQPFLSRHPAAASGSKTTSKQASTGQLPFFLHPWIKENVFFPSSERSATSAHQFL